VAIAQNPDLTQAMVYLCGAWAMVRTAEQDFGSAGLPKLNYIS
jgi:CDP-4-dehydro-6-deoxyglucose reductase